MTEAGEGIGQGQQKKRRTQNIEIVFEKGGSAAPQRQVAGVRRGQSEIQGRESQRGAQQPEINPSCLARPGHRRQRQTEPAARQQRRPADLARPNNATQRNGERERQRG